MARKRRVRKIKGRVQACKFLEKVDEVSYSGQPLCKCNKRMHYMGVNNEVCQVCALYSPLKDMTSKEMYNLSDMDEKIDYKYVEDKDMDVSVFRELDVDLPDDMEFEETFELEEIDLEEEGEEDDEEEDDDEDEEEDDLEEGLKPQEFFEGEEDEDDLYDDDDEEEDAGLYGEADFDERLILDDEIEEEDELEIEDEVSLGEDFQAEDDFEEEFEAVFDEEFGDDDEDEFSELDEDGEEGAVEEEEEPPKARVGRPKKEPEGKIDELIKGLDLEGDIYEQIDFEKVGTKEVCPFCAKKYKAIKRHLPHCKKLPPELEKAF